MTEIIAPPITGCIAECLRTSCWINGYEVDPSIYWGFNLSIIIGFILLVYYFWQEDRRT